MSPVWDASRTIGGALRIARTLTVEGYSAEGAYVFREAAVPLAGTPAVEHALQWWSGLSSNVMPDPNRPVGARLHKLARALVDVGHEGEAVRVLTLAMRHLPTSDLNFVTRRRLVAQATGTPDTPVVRELRREGLAALERGEAEGVTLLAGALRVGGPAAWPGVEVRLALRRLQPVTRLRLGQMVLQPVARAAYELGWLGQQDLAARVGMLIPTVPQMAFDIIVSQAETSPELEREIKGLSDELRQKGYLPEAAELAATVIDLGRWRQAFPRMFLNSFEVTVLPTYNIRLTGWDRVKLGAGALRDRVVPTRKIFKSELSEIDVSAAVLPLPAAPPPPDVPPPGPLPPPGEPSFPFAPKAIRSATAFPEIDPSTTHPVRGEPLTITVRLSDAPSPFVWSEGVVLGETPPEAVHTFSVHLLFGGTSAWGTLEYSVAGGTSRPAVFPVTAPPLAPGAVRRVETIAVNFYLGHRWSGEGYRNVEIRAVASVLPSRATPVPGDPAWRRTLAVAPNAAPPDLLVRIQRDPARPDTYVWTCLSRWADLRPAAEGDDRLPMPDGAERFVKNLFEPLATTELGPLMQRRVEGAGQDIYRSTPKVFKDAYWKLHRLASEEHRFEFDTIQIVTDEPYVPWELMRLADSERAADVPAEFLSIRHAVGRWVADRSCHLDQTIAIQRLTVLASDYAGTTVEPKLPWVNDERKYLRDKFGAQPCALRSAPVIEFLEHRGPEAAHFACHGQMFADAPNQSRLLLEDDIENFTPEVVGRQEVRQGFGAAHPFVFLNACQVAGTGRNLTLVAGFPAAFLQAGASAVVSPLWTVMDERAQKVTEEFYALVFGQQPVPLGTALKQIRAKWRTDRHLTYLAYVLYGDPKALVVFHPAP